MPRRANLTAPAEYNTRPDSNGRQLPTRVELRATAGATGLLIAGCAGPQSALDAQGPVSAAIVELTWVLFAGATAIFAVVMALLFYAMFRDPRRRPTLATTPFLVISGLLVPAIVLTGLLVYSTGINRRITAAVEQPLRIEVTGHQWWWEVRYPAGAGAPAVRTANELRLPAGVPVEFSVRSADVVHSFWIPALAGKVDMIPGRVNTLRLLADAAGRFNVQCSEFCGAQHAQMGMVVIVEPQSAFDEWRRERAAPATGATHPGMAVFLERGCAACHAIDGTQAHGGKGPVLTHLASRPGLGGRAAANTPQALRSWLADHGLSLKPGSLGPQPRELPAADVESIAQFLEQLR